MLRNLKIFLNQLSAATDRICSLQEEQQQLREQNELIREKSEKSVEVRSRPCSWAACSPLIRVHQRSQAQNVQRCLVWHQKILPQCPSMSLSGHLDCLGFPKCTAPLPLGLCEWKFLFPLQLLSWARSPVVLPLAPISRPGPFFSRVSIALCTFLHYRIRLLLCRIAGLQLSHLMTWE